MKVGEMEDSIRVKLSVKPDSKVCLFHARKELLPQFMKGDLRLMLDWAENDCDSIIQDVLRLTRTMKRNRGRKIC